MPFFILFYVILFLFHHKRTMYLQSSHNVSHRLICNYTAVHRPGVDNNSYKNTLKGLKGHSASKERQRRHVIRVKIRRTMTRNSPGITNTKGRQYYAAKTIMNGGQLINS